MDASANNSGVADSNAATAVPLERRPIFWFYGSSSIAFGIKDNAFSYLLLTFANQALGVPGYLASAALAIAIIWDAITDPLLGHWSDKTRSKLGRRHPFMYASLFIFPASFYALFNPSGDVRGEDAFVFVLVLSILIRTGTTLFEVPANALLPDLEKDYDRRNRWLALRHLFAWEGGGLIHIINLFFWVGAYGFLELTGYAIYGTVGAIIITLVIIIATFGTQREAMRMPAPKEVFKLSAFGGEVAQIFDSLKNRNFAALFTYSLIGGAAAGISTALYLYITRFFFGFSGTQIAISAITVLIAPIVAYPLAPRFGFRFGKKTTAIAMALMRLGLYPTPYIALLLGFWPALGSNASLAIYSSFVFVEVTMVIISGVMIDSMMADIVEDSERRTNRRSEGLFFATRGLAGKFVAAAGIISAGFIVSSVGFDAITTLADFTNEHRVTLAYLFLPTYCVLVLGAIACITLYKIDRESHNENLRALGRQE